MGEENVPKRAPSRKLLDPSRRAAGLLSHGFFVQEKQINDTRGWGKCRVQGGSQAPLCMGGVSFVRFSFPLFFPLPRLEAPKGTLPKGTGGKVKF